MPTTRQEVIDTINANLSDSVLIKPVKHREVETKILDYIDTVVGAVVGSAPQFKTIDVTAQTNTVTISDLHNITIQVLFLGGTPMSEGAGGYTYTSDDTSTIIDFTNIGGVQDNQVKFIYTIDS